MAYGGMQAAGQKISSKHRVYDLHDQTAIMGWCGEKNIGQVPRIWSMWSATANAKTHRTDLPRAMATWGKATRRQIDEPAFSDASIKEDTALKLNPGMSGADYDSCNRGETPLSCLRTANSNRVNQNLPEEAREFARDNMTPTEYNLRDRHPDRRCQKS